MDLNTEIKINNSLHNIIGVVAEEIPESDFVFKNELVDIQSEINISVYHLIELVNSFRIRKKEIFEKMMEYSKLYLDLKK